MRVFLLTLLFLDIFTRPARAYIDPGTGSYMLQLVVGGLLGGVYLVKTYWQSIKGRLGKRPFPTRDDHDPETDDR